MIIHHAMERLSSVGDLLFLVCECTDIRLLFSAGKCFTINSKVIFLNKAKAISETSKG